MISFERDDRTLTCLFAGLFDTRGCQAVEQQIRDQVADAPACVVFDLAGVTAISSCFLKICIETSHGLADREFRIINVSSVVRKAFEAARLTEVMDIE